MIYEQDIELVHAIGKRFKEYRIQQKKRQREVAQEAGVSYPTLNNFENGVSKNISLNVLMKLFKIIGEEEQLKNLLKKKS